MRKLLFFCWIVFAISCQKNTRMINLEHSLSLMDSVAVEGKMLSYIWIYADAPDYQPVAAAGEGVTCVDDVGRYLEVLEYEILTQKNNALVPLAKNMVNFLLYMCRDDGLWYNFINEKGAINTTHINSKAEFGFWAIRGLRGLTAGYNIFQSDSNLSLKIRQKIETMDIHLSKALENYDDVTKINTIEKPMWMIKGAADMTNELLLVLTKLQQSGDFDYIDEIEKFSEALILSQYQNAGSKINGMYFCWNNTWHAWGNSQAFALLESYKITGNEACLESVKLWADHFVPFFIAENFPRKITVINDEFDLETFPQIAYGINSAYRGIASLAALTGDPKYKNYSEKIFQWYLGKNIANTPMYYSEKGRCYDGINNKGSINKNSGAESTIEALLSMQFKEKIFSAEFHR